MRAPLRTASSLASWSSAQRGPQSPAPWRASSRAGSAPSAARARRAPGVATSGPKANRRCRSTTSVGTKTVPRSVVRRRMPAVPACRTAGLVVGVGGVPTAGGDHCGHGVLLIVSAGSTERSKASPCSAECAMDRPVRTGSSGGHRARKRSPLPEPSWRGDGAAGCQRGGAPERPLEPVRRRSTPPPPALSPARVTFSGVTGKRHPGPRRRAGGSLPRPRRLVRRSRPRGSRPGRHGAQSDGRRRWRSADSHRSRRP